MRWVSLGHAMWLANAGEVRILFDPLLTPTHCGDVFEPWPPRTIDEESLEPDFIVITHRHPDHFDVPSLARLARRDRAAVILTPDPLVERAARRLGFESVACIAAKQRIELAGATLVTTPSLGPCLEWGMAVATSEGVVFNQVDSVLGGRDGVLALRRLIAAALGSEHRELALALVRWQPALEVQAMLAGPIGFPHESYRELLDEIAALEARVLVPTAAGVRHSERYGWLNRMVYPVSEGRFRVDLAARCPSARVYDAPPGTVFEVRGGEVARGLARSLAVAEPAASEPFAPLSIPPLSDPNLEGHDNALLVARVERFVGDELAPALTRSVSSAHCLVLQVFFPEEVRSYTFRTGSDVVIERAFDPDYDVLDAVAASYLVAVLDGRRHWGEVLLGGMLRASVRSYSVDASGYRRVAVAPIFLYYALSYDDSHERWVEYQLAAVEAGR
jgi:UDP-MurNAc hydroxylase